jgi:hypothetical protein
MTPASPLEFRTTLLGDLDRVVFDTKIKLFIGVMDSPVVNHPVLGPIYAKRMRLASCDYEEVLAEVINEIGHDLLLIAKKFPERTAYYFLIHEVPVTSHLEGSMICYAKHSL